MGPWGREAVGPWDYGAMGPQGHGPWDYGAMGPWAIALRGKRAPL